MILIMCFQETNWLVYRWVIGALSYLYSLNIFFYINFYFFYFITFPYFSMYLHFIILWKTKESEVYLQFYQAPSY